MCSLETRASGKHAYINLSPPPQTPLLDKKKTGVYRGKHYFLFAQQHRLWVVDRVPAIYVLRRYKKYIFHHKIFIFGEKFSMYLFSKWNEALYVDGCKNRLTDKGRELTRTVFEQKSEITASPPTHTHSPVSRLSHFYCA
ncbi:MAG: hypothetical protein N0C90_04255, partial [Candidatus Thiodiazotropha endolucinida]|nr:hypothetical protein [Candidatus Thiodiazotropha taylori]MCW4260558.1 hypothetical protein [Candidatus Thiodiazotropha endolucinida]